MRTDFFRIFLTGSRAQALKYWLIVALLALTLCGGTLQLTTANAEAIKAPIAVVDEAATKETFTHYGKTREYRIFVPSGYNPAKPIPVVLIFHGYLSTDSLMPKMTGFNALAEKENFIAVYPEMTENRWLENVTPNDSSDEDVTFTRALIARLKKQFTVDPQRIFANGFSDGGFFTQRLACEMSTEIAAFSTVAATISESTSQTCQPRRPVPIQMFNGSKDPVVLWRGQFRRVRYAFRGAEILSVPQTITFWRHKNACHDAPYSEISLALAPKKEGVTITHYYGCKPGGSLEQVVIYGGGHTWPGSTQPESTIRLPFGRFFIGAQTKNPDASTMIWEFFKAHPLPLTSMPDFLSPPTMDDDRT